MKGVLNPAGQPLGKVVNKLFKRFLREIFGVWEFTYPINPTSGDPLPTSRHQVASWVVQAWDRIPEELCTKAWTDCV